MSANAETLTPSDVIAPPDSGRGAKDGDGDGGQGRGGDRDGGGFGLGGGPRRVTRRTYVMGVYLALAPIVMLFTALASAYVVRAGLSGDWLSMNLPSILWLNSVVLLASSGSVEWSRRVLKAGRRDAFQKGWLISTLLGLAFLGGQWMAWLQLQEQGVFLTTNPSHSFFYLLTALHAVHLVIGVLALGYVLGKGKALRVDPGRGAMVADLAAIYWHFLDVLWVMLFVLLLWK